MPNNVDHSPHRRTPRIVAPCAGTCAFFCERFPKQRGTKSRHYPPTLCLDRIDCVSRRCNLERKGSPLFIFDCGCRAGRSWWHRPARVRSEAGAMPADHGVQPDNCQFGSEVVEVGVPRLASMSWILIRSMANRFQLPGTALAISTMAEFCSCAIAPRNSLRRNMQNETAGQAPRDEAARATSIIS